MSVLADKDGKEEQRCEVTGKRMSVLEKGRQLPHKQPEPQRVHTHSTGSVVRDPLGNTLSQGQCYQNNLNFTASTSLNMSAGFTHSQKQNAMMWKFQISIFYSEYNIDDISNV